MTQLVSLWCCRASGLSRLAASSPGQSRAPRSLRSYRAACCRTSLSSASSRPVTSFTSLILLRIKFTRNIGAFVGRAIAGVGWVILASDVTMITYRSVTTYNSMVKPEDRLYG